MLALFVKDVAPATFRLRKIRNPFADPQYSVDHGPLLHISAGDVTQQTYFINSSASGIGIDRM